MQIYLACPYSDSSSNVRFERFNQVNIKAAQLMNQGHIVFSPISHSHPIAVQCDLPLGFDFWEAFDRSFIGWCDEVWVYTLEGWEESTGVQAEIKSAAELNKPVRYI